MTDRETLRTILREFRLFRDAALGRLDNVETRMSKVEAALVELNKTVRSIPGLIDKAVKQDANTRVLEARLKLVEEDTARGNGKRNGGHAR